MSPQALQEAQGAEEGPLSAVAGKRRRASATQRDVEEAMRVKVRVTYHVERFFRTEGPRTSRNHKTHYLKKVAGIHNLSLEGGFEEERVGSWVGGRPTLRAPFYAGAA